MIPNLKSGRMSEVIWSFIVGWYLAMCKCSRIFLLKLCFGAEAIIDHVNERSGFDRRCFAGSDLVDGMLCSVQRMSEFLSVSPM